MTTFKVSITVKYNLTAMFYMMKTDKHFLFFLQIVMYLSNILNEIMKWGKSV